MYIALRQLRVQDGNRVREIAPGSEVDVTGWTERIVRAHVNQNLIKESLGTAAVSVKTTIKRTPAKTTLKKSVEGSKAGAL